MHGRVMNMNMKYEIDIYRFLARCWALLEQNKEWLAQCHNTGAEYDIRSWPGFLVEQHY